MEYKLNFLCCGYYSSYNKRITLFSIENNGILYESARLAYRLKQNISPNTPTILHFIVVKFPTISYSIAKVCF